MKIKQAFFLAIKSLATSKMRALLTMLGIIIGVGAVIVIISLGTGLRNMMESQFESLGSNIVQAFLQTNSPRAATPEDMEQLVYDNPDYLVAVSPIVTVPSFEVRTQYEAFTPNGIYGVGEQYASARNIKLSDGRFLQYVDVLRMQKVCVVGSYIDQEYYDGAALGKTIGIRGYTYTIIGVATETAESRKGTDDDMLYIPYTNAQHLAGVAPSSYVFTGANKDSSATARTLIENELERIYGTDDQYFVMTSAEILDMMNVMMDTLMNVLVAIAAISLLVGGIGIMNIMLVSVTERTREIGVRKSLGAKQQDIRNQFIIEAATTSAIGGIIGILFGVLSANVASLIISKLEGGEDFTATPTLGAVLLSFGVSVAVGIVFGYLPANKASQLNPIDALRYD